MTYALLSPDQSLNPNHTLRSDYVIHLSPAQMTQPNVFAVEFFIPVATASSILKTQESRMFSRADYGGAWVA